MKKIYEQPKISAYICITDILMTSSITEDLSNGDWGVNDDVFEGIF